MLQPRHTHYRATMRLRFCRRSDNVCEGCLSAAAFQPYDASQVERLLVEYGTSQAEGGVLEVPARYVRQGDLEETPGATGTAASALTVL